MRELFGDVLQFSTQVIFEVEAGLSFDHQQ